MKTLTSAASGLGSAMLSAEFTGKHLQRALKISTPTTALLLLPLIARAAQLQADISALIDALNATE